MGFKSTFLNTSLTETGANTVKTSQIAVPGSTGAKSVSMVACRLVGDIPDAVATTWTHTKSAVAVGKVTLTTCTPEEASVVVSQDLVLYSAAGPTPAILAEADKGHLESAVGVPPDPTDKTFNITAGVKGTSNTGAKTVRLLARFLVEV